MLPIHYAVRNLSRRRARTVVTLLVLAAITLLVSSMGSFASALGRATRGDVGRGVVVLLGTSSESDVVRSVVPRGKAEAAAASAPRVADIDGVRAASVELHLASRVGDRVGLMRGVTDAVFAVRREAVVVEGREPRAPFELLVGRLAAERMGLAKTDLVVGGEVELEGRAWTVCGRFAAPGTLYEAEMWARLDDLMLATRRQDVSCVALRLDADDAGAEAEVALFAAARQDLEVAAVPERELLRRIDEGVRPIARLAAGMALLVLICGMLATANTVFAAVLARTKELGTLRAIGYTAPALGISLVTEALVVAFLGAGLGVLAASAVGDFSLRFPMGALEVRSETSIRAATLGAVLLSSAVGAVIPAVRAARQPLPDALAGRV